MIKRLQQLRELPKQDWRVLLISLFSLPTIAITLNLLGYKKTKGLLSSFMPSETSHRPATKKELVEAHATAKVINIAARHNIFKANCLKQTLLLWFLLGRKSIYSEIKIGIPTVAGSEFSAHAWVVCNGEPLIDSEDTINKFSAF